jgi:hypothetical protein
VAIEKRGIPTTIKIIKIPKGRKAPKTSAHSDGSYVFGDHITINCYTEKKTTPIIGDSGTTDA